MPVSNQKPDTDIAEDTSHLMENFRSKHKYRQTVMSSATARRGRATSSNPSCAACVLLHRYFGRAVDKVEQVVYMMNENDEPVDLYPQRRDRSSNHHLRHSRRRGADVLAKGLEKMGYNAAHPRRKGPGSRDTALAGLKGWRQGYPGRQDVAGRGMARTSLVINYDMAKSIEMTTSQKNGRTGRAGKSGKAITFHNKSIRSCYDLKEMLICEDDIHCPPELSNHQESKR